MAPHSSIVAWKIPWTEEPGRLQSMGSLRVRWLSDFPFTFHFHALEKEMATHSSVLAWRITGTGEPDGLPSLGLHRVGHDWSDLAAAAYSFQNSLWQQLCCCSVSQHCPTLCNPMDCSTPGFLVIYPSPGACSNSCPLSQWCHPTISSSVVPLSCLQSFPATGSFLMSQLIASGGQIIGASASVLPMNIQGWFPLGLTGFISLQTKGLSRIFTNTTVEKHQFFDAQPSLGCNCHIHTWLLKMATALVSIKTRWKLTNQILVISN